MPAKLPHRLFAGVRGQRRLPWESTALELVRPSFLRWPTLPDPPRRHWREHGPFVVEVAGLPGAGKSTLAGRWVDLLATQGATIERLPAAPRSRRSPPADLRALWARLVAHPADGLRAAALTGSGLGALAGLTRLAAHLSELDACRELDADLVILDEAVVQDLWSLGRATPWPVAAAALRPLAASLVARRRYALLLADSPADVFAQRRQARREAIAGVVGASYFGGPPAAHRDEALLDRLYDSVDVPRLRWRAAEPADATRRRLLDLTVQLTGRLDGLRVATNAPAALAG